MIPFFHHFFKLFILSVIINFLKLMGIFINKKILFHRDSNNLSTQDSCRINPNNFSHSTFPYNDVVMAHKGLSGFYPEHSLRAFELAYFMGAHYLETDVNLTKDNKLIIFHDPYLDDTTDILEHEEFQHRRRDQIIERYAFKNKFFVSDFTYEELLTLYLKQRDPYRPQLYNKEYKILLIEDLIQMVINYNIIQNKSTGIFIETKWPRYYEERFLVNIDEQIVKVLKKFGLADRNSEKFKLCPIVFQSFNYDSLLYFRTNANIPQIALMKWWKFYNLKELKQVSDGVGPDVDFILFERIDDLLYFNGIYYENKEDFKKNVVKKGAYESIESLGSRVMNAYHNKFICYASYLGLVVYPWNLNNDYPKFHMDPVIEYAKLSSLGVSGFFSDFCHTAIMGIEHSKDLIKKMKRHDH